VPVQSSTPSPAKVLPTHTPALFEAAVAEAVRLLKAGEVVVLPTETVYGLAANAFIPAAVARIYDIKGRPAHNPIIVHVVGHQMARACAKEWPDSAHRLATAFWPGPLTLVVQRAPVIPDIVTADGPTVGLRWPSHPLIQAVIRTCNFPLAAPSANLANQLSPTNAQHVQAALGDRVALIIDGGQSQVGIESTVVDVTSRDARILRPGMIHAEAVQSVTPLESEPGSRSDSASPRRSPGMLEKHYAPRAKLVLLAWENDEGLARELRAARLVSAETHVIAHTNIPSPLLGVRVSVIPHDAEAYGRALYSELHRCAAEGAKTIIVEKVSETAEWNGIADRLRRAAS